MLGILIKVSLERMSVLIRNCGGSHQHLFENSRNRSAAQDPVDLNTIAGFSANTDTVPQAWCPGLATMPQGLVGVDALSWLQQGSQLALAFPRVASEPSGARPWARDGTSYLGWGSNPHQRLTPSSG